jgi:hypothetical protein
MLLEPAPSRTYTCESEGACGMGIVFPLLLLPGLACFPLQDKELSKLDWKQHGAWNLVSGLIREPDGKYYNLTPNQAQFLITDDKLIWFETVRDHKTIYLLQCKKIVESNGLTVIKDYTITNFMKKDEKQKGEIKIVNKGEIMVIIFFSESGVNFGINDYAERVYVLTHGAIELAK